MRGQKLAAELFEANPGPAVHLALVGIVAGAALAVFGIVRRRNKRDAAEAEIDSTTRDHSPGHMTHRKEDE